MGRTPYLIGCPHPGADRVCSSFDTSSGGGFDSVWQSPITDGKRGTRVGFADQFMDRRDGHGRFFHG
ncbi:UNVERIFIED_CONTAM: hypothetical protein Slati_1775100 [Sesamum latifolium]|uniref:Uncharacterized protein n=1 Tax=Sesamum latifolium TaxID=2727402 RepID=A0AAW2WX41_9LAMI